MCVHCGWSQLSEKIERMMDDASYRFALRTLDGIYRGVVGNEHCSHGQREAVSNIEDAVLRRRNSPRRSSRKSA
jgi:hypothetical protein